jgi:hypothetical protein
VKQFRNKKKRCREETLGGGQRRLQNNLNCLWRCHLNFFFFFFFLHNYCVFWCTKMDNLEGLFRWRG